MTNYEHIEVMAPEPLEIIARAIVEAMGESADSPVSRFNGTDWDTVGPLWAVDGIPIAAAAIIDLTASGYVILSVGRKP